MSNAVDTNIRAEAIGFTSGVWLGFVRAGSVCVGGGCEAVMEMLDPVVHGR